MNDDKRVVFVANRGYALTSSRKSFVQRFLSSGWKVLIATTDDNESQKLCDLGAYLEPTIFHRGGFALTADLGSYRRLLAIYRKWKPNLVHHFHAKPVILGTLAAHSALGDSVQIVNTITGLGNAFIAGGLSTRLASLGYRLALSHAATTIFQNKDDCSLFLEHRWVTEYQARLIISSGVNTEYFSFVDRHKRDGDAPVIVMLGRLLRQKGILEFVEVASRVRQLWPKARFIIAGEEDTSHSSSVRAEWLHKQKDIDYLERLADVRPVLLDADLFLFPSYYREGVPRVILEAAAMGVPAIGYDVPGVREAILDGLTGYIVPERNIDRLTNRVIQLLDDKSLRLCMGLHARKRMEDFFEESVIEEQYFQVYHDLGIEVN